MTNNLQTALQLAKKPNINHILLGGSVQNNTNSASGSWTARQLNDFSFDLMISSCASVLGKDVYESSIETKEVKRAAFDHCKRRLLIFDHSKFGAHATYRFTELSAYDLVVTDAPPPAGTDEGDVNFIY